MNTINELGDKLELVLQGAGQTIYLEKLMAPEILKANRQLILRDIKNAESEKEKVLMRLIHKPAIENPEWKEAVADMVAASTQSVPAITMVPVVTMEKDKGSKEENVKAAVKTPANKKSTLPDEEERRVITKLYIEKEMTVKEVAAEMGLTDTNIYDRLKKYGIPVRKRVKTNAVPAEKNEKTDVSNEVKKTEVLRSEKVIFDRKWQQEVIEMLKSGKTVFEIARHYNMDKTVLYNKMNEFGIKPKLYKPC